MKKIYKVEITPKTIIFTIALLGLIWLIIKVFSVFFLIFIAFAISAMLSPVIDYLKMKKVPRTISIALIYLLFFTIIILLVSVSYKPIITQLEEFIRALPDIFVNVVNSIVDRLPFIKEKFNWEEILNNLKDSFWQSIEVSDLSKTLIDNFGKALGVVGSVFTAIINIFATIILSIYFLQFKEKSKQKFIKLIPLKHQKRIFKLINKIETQLGSWLRAQLILMTIIGLLAWIGMELVGMKFSIPMGIVAGLLEVIPNLGPTITWFLAIVVATGSQMPLWKIIFIALWFIMIQQLENYVIIPKLMQKFVGINPVITIIAILIASKIFDLWGALLAVPTVAIIQIALREYLAFRGENKKAK